MKSIRYNIPRKGDKDEFDAEANFTLHTDGVTVYFERIRETNAGYVFVKYDADVAWVADDKCDVSPTAAKDLAEENPGEKVPFADE